MSENDLFSQEAEPTEKTPNQPDPEKNYFEELVGDNRKFKSQEDLAKGKIESDMFIDHLKGELAELRTELAKRESAKDLARQLQEQMSTSQQSTQNTQSELSNALNRGPEQTSENQTSGLSQEDVDALMDRKLQELQQNTSRQQNLESTVKELDKYLGPSYPTELKKIASELGMSEGEMDNLAKSSPQALIQLVKSARPANSGSTLAGNIQSAHSPQTSDGSMSMTSGTRKTYKDFEQLRKDDPAKYFTPAVQNEMFNWTKVLGEDFFN